MKQLHWINGSAWLANALTWAFYAHVPMMAVASLLAAGIAVYLAVTSDDWRHR